MSEQPSNPWIERFTNHPLHGGLSAADQALEAAEAVANDDFDAVTSVSRARAVLARVRAMLSDCDPALVQLGVLDSVNSSSAQVFAETTAYASDHDQVHLANANGHADAMLIGAGPLPVNRTPSSAKALGEAATALRRAVDKYVVGIRADAEKTRSALGDLRAETATATDEIRARSAALGETIRAESVALGETIRAQATASVETIRPQVDALTLEISQQKARLDAAITGFQQLSSAAEAERTKQFGESEAKRLELGNAAEELRRTQHSAALEERRAQHVAALEERKVAFETLTQESKKRFEDLEKIATDDTAARSEAFKKQSDEQTKALETLSTETLAAAAGVLQKIDAELAKAEKIVHVVGNTGMVGGYQQTADAERQSSRNWSNITVVAMFALIGVAIWTLTTAPHDFTWPYLGSRVFVASAVAILATYAGNRASGHRTEERHLRRTELEMASIDPYLALLPEGDRNTVKMKVAERLFAQAEAREPDKSGPSGSIVDLAKTMSETAKSAFDAAKSIGEKK